MMRVKLFAELRQTGCKSLKILDASAARGCYMGAAGIVKIARTDASRRSIRTVVAKWQPKYPQVVRQGISRTYNGKPEALRAQHQGYQIGRDVSECRRYRDMLQTPCRSSAPTVVKATGFPFCQGIFPGHARTSTRQDLCRTYPAINPRLARTRATFFNGSWRNSRVIP